MKKKKKKETVPLFNLKKSERTVSGAGTCQWGQKKYRPTGLARLGLDPLFNFLTVFFFFSSRNFTERERGGEGVVS